MSNLELKDIIREMIVLDLICQEEEAQLKIAIFGGAALLMHLGDDVFRATQDIDFRVEEVSSKEKLKRIMDLKPGVFHPLGMFPEFPDQELYQENGKEYFELEGIVFENLRIFLPSIEMLALSKLMSNREKDLEDLKTKPIMDKCDLAMLQELVEEAKTYKYQTSEYNFHEWDGILKARKL